MLDFQHTVFTLCPSLVPAAARSGDELCRHVFTAAGEHLGAMARTLAPHLSSTSGEPRKGHMSIKDVPIICVGSVWKSVDLFWDDFLRAATSTGYGDGGNDTSISWNIRSLKLLRLEDTAAIGAAWKAAADATGTGINLDKTPFVEEIKTYDAGNP
eukprot:gb/GECG01013518.1/.p1 GENE.gb/GECG01013518.1/~~gb/GECG01013518.1/.p1  ORF type:complete len:156 (+),score=23.41 gb/GECG01013518.1/:1-468(+)